MGYTPNYSHLVGIMISKTIGCRGTRHFQTNPNGNSRFQCDSWLKTVFQRHEVGAHVQSTSNLIVPINPPMAYCFNSLVVWLMQLPKNILIHPHLFVGFNPNVSSQNLFFLFFFPIECRSWLRSSCVSWSTHGQHPSSWRMVIMVIDQRVMAGLASRIDIPAGWSLLPSGKLT